MELSKIKVKEIANITGTSLPLISRYFKDRDNTEVIRQNNRIQGITPDAAEKYLRKVGLGYFYRPAIILSANLCGGVGKTTSIYSLGASLRRITGKETPIVFVDGDSQGSFTSLVFGEPAENDEPLLIDFLENRVKIEDILTNIGNNVWFVKSNLNNVSIEKVLTKPQDIKKGMLRFYQAIFDKLGGNTKIFQDHTPQLSALFASSVCALSQLESSLLKSIIVPIRPDKFAINGAEKTLEEVSELMDVFSLDHNFDIHCFLSNKDKRVSTTEKATNIIKNKENIMKYWTFVFIRYSSEIPKTIISHPNASSIYSSGKKNKPAEDYQSLLQYIFSYKQDKDI
jgi:cellulose biosynthesis protein BcsQ